MGEWTVACLKLVYFHAIRRFQPDAADWRFALIATAVALLLLFALLSGNLLGPAIFGFLLVALTRGTNSAQAPLLSHLGLIAVGMLLSFVAFSAGGEATLSAVTLGLVVGIGYVVARVGTGSPGVWEILSLWAVIAMIAADSVRPTDAALGFGLGALVAFAAIRLFSPRVPGEADFPRTDGLRSVMPGALVGVVIAGSVLAGFALFPETPYWVPLTVVVVHQPNGVIWGRAVERTSGTIAGVVLGWLVLTATSSEGVLVLVTVVFMFLQMLFLRVDYALMVTFLTAVVVVGSAIAADDPTALGLARLGATLVGAAIAVTLSWLVGNLRTESRGIGAADTVDDA